MALHLLINLGLVALADLVSLVVELRPDHLLLDLLWRHPVLADPGNRHDAVAHLGHQRDQLVGNGCLDVIQQVLAVADVGAGGALLVPGCDQLGEHLLLCVSISARHDRAQAVCFG
ncbi:hypothetical protein D3C76_725360 [compost metagenome]